MRHISALLCRRQQHGSLFINDIEGPVKKFVYQDGSSILVQLKDWLQSDKKPLIVLEGNPQDKLKLINEKPYLLDCLRMLKRVNDDLFILGFSVNEKADKHIIDKIQESNVKRIFLSFHEKDDDEFIEKAKLLTHVKRSKEERPVFIFNAKDATTWKTIKLDN